MDTRVIIELSYTEFLDLACHLFGSYSRSRKFEDNSVIDYWPVTLAYPQGSIRVYTKHVLYMFVPTR